MSDDISTALSLVTPSDQDLMAMERLMSDGKRNYICNQPQLALDCFVQLCERLSKHYGRESEKCIEAYLYYGKTLLDIAKLENGVLTKESPSSDSEADYEEYKEKGKTGEEHIEEKTENVEERQEQFKEKGDTDEIDCADGNKTASNMEELKTKNVQINYDACCEGIESDDEETEDVTNMELAWEMFELTSVMCKRQLQREGNDGKKIKFTLAEARNGLAQVSLETEQYEEAVRDFCESLDLYKEVLENKNDRVIAETHYNIALALSSDRRFAEAIEHFTSAVSALKARIGGLEMKVKEVEEKGGGGQPPVELKQWKKEISDLNDLIQLEMMTRIQDARESIRLLDESMKTVQDDTGEMFGFDHGGFADAQGFDSPFSNDQVVHDGTAGIKAMKRKNEDQDSQVPPKK